MKQIFRVSICCFAVASIWVGSAVADQVVNDDQIIGASLCVGADCVLDENFDFDTIRLKTDDPVIRFQDTSSTSSFPTNDWLMGISDSGDTGPSSFFIDDVDSGSRLLLLEPGETGGIAIGANSTPEPNAISVGLEGGERRIVHLAPGVDDSDAVNMAQFNQFVADVDVLVEAEETAIDQKMLDLQDEVNAITLRISELASQLDEL